LRGVWLRPKACIRKGQISKNHIFGGEKKTRKNSLVLRQTGASPEIRRRKHGSFRKMATREKKMSKISQKKKKAGDQEMWIHLFTSPEWRGSL
jgi:hypothetical protein